MKYIQAVEPGWPPDGWRDITPYFVEYPRTLRGYTQYALKFGYLVCRQVVTENGLRYRRVAVALAPIIPGITNAATRRKRTNT
jgi:hypothetical protein